MKNALILLAGGIGKRLVSADPKQFVKIGNINIIEYFLTNLDSKIFDIIIIAVKKEDKIKYLSMIKKKFFYHNIEFSRSGNTRQESSRYSLNYLRKYKVKKVLIHDSARPLASNKLFKKIINQLNKNSSCIPHVIYNDLIKINQKIILKNDKIINIQTPQGFDFNQILKAHNLHKNLNFKDDSTVFEKQGLKIHLTKGELSNIKITNKDDFNYFNIFKKREQRSGIGYDIHKIDFKSNRKLILCGLKIKHKPLIGHSDADVGYHAVCDSILGSLSLRDIGYYFNDNNKKWKNANSEIFIKFCANKLIEKGYKIVNLDINFICETPNINKISNKMKINLSKLLKLKTQQISIKATTNEKIALIGNGEGIAAESIVQIIND